MDESKVKRLIVAGTVGAVLLATILLIVVMYQVIAIGVKNKRIEEYKEQIAVLDSQIQANENNLAAIKQRDWIIYEARKLGYTFEGDISLD